MQSSMSAWGKEMKTKVEQISSQCFSKFGSLNQVKKEDNNPDIGETFRFPLQAGAKETLRFQVKDVFPTVSMLKFYNLY